MMDEEHYLIPRAIPLRYEFFPGWGWPEFGMVAVGVVVGAVAFSLGTWGFHWPQWLRVVTLVWPPVITYFLALPGLNDQSFWRQVWAWSHYRRQPRIWLYDWGREGHAKGGDKT